MIKNPDALVKILVGNYGESSNISSKGDIAFFCPFCGHHKKKLNVNVNTGFWHCWVCQNGSKSIVSLFKKTKASADVIKNVISLLDSKSKGYGKENGLEVVSGIISLPKEYRPLNVFAKNPEYKNAMHYLKKRKISKEIIDRYNIGYCAEGKYSGRLIVPSYDESGMVNYFVARSYYEHEEIKKYDNPVAPKNIVPFELYVSWIFPIILVEGVFDAMAIDRNAIPILGNSINEAIIEKLLIEGVQQVYLALDADAMRFVYREIMKLIDAGIQVNIVELPPDKDPGEMEQSEFLKLIDSSMNSQDLKTKMKFKLLSNNHNK